MRSRPDSTQALERTQLVGALSQPLGHRRKRKVPFGTKPLLPFLEITCIMTKKSILNAILEEKRSQVEQQGWTLQHVLSTQTAPAYSYTIGLSKHGKPDLVMKGIGAQSADEILKTIVGQLLSGELKGVDGERVEKAANSTLYLKAAPDALELFYVGAMRFAEQNNHKFSYLQVVWSDPADKFPWEEGFDPWMAELQRLDKTDVSV